MRSDLTPNTLRILAIGSNDQPEQHISLAVERLRRLFPAIRFAACRETKPLYIANPANFLNQVGVFESDEPIASLKQLFKEIEREAGRLPEEREHIPLDIDLLCYGQQLLKPEELKRDYVIASLQELRITP